MEGASKKRCVSEDSAYLEILSGSIPLVGAHYLIHIFSLLNIKHYEKD